MKNAGILERSMNELSEKIAYYLEKRADGKIKTEFVVYSNTFGELIKSKGADKWLTLLARDQAQRI